jgi:hypothetical protein
MNKVVQICVESDRVYALCADGSVWALDVLDTKSGSKWERLPEIPKA